MEKSKKYAILVLDMDPMMPNNDQIKFNTKKKKFNWNITEILIAVLILLTLAGAGAGYYFYRKYQKAQQTLSNPAEAGKQEVKQVTDKVGKLMELPTGEDPTLATVSDKSKLKDQPFFAKAEVGDRVLIYTGAKKAILYRPSTNRIIEVAPINITPVDNSGATPTPTSDNSSSNPTVTATSYPTIISTSRPTTTPKK